MDRAILASSTICLLRISGDIEIDDDACGTKSTTTQDVLDTSNRVDDEWCKQSGVAFVIECW